MSTRAGCRGGSRVPGGSEWGQWTEHKGAEEALGAGSSALVSLAVPSLALPTLLSISTHCPGSLLLGFDKHLYTQFSSVQSCPTLCDPMDRSTPGFPVHHQLPELTQTHAHRVGDAIQPSLPVVPFSSCPQSLPASGSFPVSLFFASSGQSIGVSASASVLPMNIQDWFPLGLTAWISLQSKGLSKVFSTGIG